MAATGAIWRNWGRSESVRPVRVERPASVGAVQRAVQAAASAGLPIKAIGAGHSFTGIAVAPGVQLELSGLRGVIAHNVAKHQVTLAAGTNLYQLPGLLAPLGMALPNMGDVDKQTIAGATSTGTHGTGLKLGGLATQIIGLTLVTGRGELMRIGTDCNGDTSNAELLPAARLGLGALGVIVDITMQLVPAFALQAVERPEPLAAVMDGFLERTASVDHFEFYWFPHTETALTKTNTRLPGDAALAPIPPFKRWVDDELVGNTLYRALCNLGRLAPATIPRLSRLADKVTGNRDFTDLSPSVFTTSRTVRFREMEYAVPLEAVPAALAEVRALIERMGWKISFPLEVRAAAADDNWLSTAYGRESGYIAVHRFFREDPEEYFRAVEQIMIAHDGRPHWGKMHYRDAESLRAVYPRFDDFLAVRDQLDPDRVFANPYLRRVLGD
ncbi:D-arabinono-1,4-lactone oxidase [Microterricola pindariensis]|uniref:FAD-linked oxidoreductase n=1 Tax=Microterricola pindariensis TaxID=478010 RepID=A0ABX5ASZ0_9MICO|nr:D-arabinono-1,4-lactone oxidase [Microterricola pindariensis]PPL14656.1 FAD-linked oxidoreductase [Microterricola pindariensis]